MFSAFKCLKEQLKGPSAGVSAGRTFYSLEGQKKGVYEAEYFNLRKMTAPREEPEGVWLCVCVIGCLGVCVTGCVHSWLPPPQAPLKRTIQQKVIHVQFRCEIKRDLSLLFNAHRCI